MLTLKQFAEFRRQEYARSTDGVTIKMMRDEYPDNAYLQDYADYVQQCAKYEVFTKRQLDHYYAVFGGNALRVLLKFHPNVAPEYYTHPDFR